MTSHKCPPWTDCPICGAKATSPAPESPTLATLLATSSAPPATTSTSTAELAGLRAENERLRTEVRELYTRLAEVRDVQRSLETLIVAGVAALEAVDRLGLRAPSPATQQSPSLLAWLRGVLAKRPDARPDAPPPLPPLPPRH